jgi:hypothetical protein
VGESSIADVSEVHSTSIFRVKEYTVGDFHNVKCREEAMVFHVTKFLMASVLFYIIYLFTIILLAFYTTFIDSISVIMNSLFYF